MGENVFNVYPLNQPFPPLRALESRQGRHLRGGEQQMLPVGPALMGNPVLPPMDERTQGLAPLLIRNLAEQVRRLKKEGVTVLLSEQNVAFAGPLADRIYVIDHGTMRFEGTLKDLEANEEIRRRYLLT